MTKIKSSFSLGVMKDEAGFLVESREYSSRGDLIPDPFREFLRKNPEKRTRAALVLYREKKASLMRAAEIAEMDVKKFEDILKKNVNLNAISEDSEEVEQVEERL
jgi:predicted HTH domain antitoxin